VEFLKEQGRAADAWLIADTGARAEAVWDKDNSKLRELSKQLSEWRPPSQTNTTLQQLETRRAKAEESVAQTQATLKKLRALNHDELEKALPKAVTDTELGKLFAERATAEQNFASIKQQFGPQDPKYKIAEQMVKNLQQEIDERMEGVLGGLQARLDADSAFITTLKERIEKAQAWRKVSALKEFSEQLEESPK
jgi:hypothetical protein